MRIRAQINDFSLCQTTMDLFSFSTMDSRKSATIISMFILYSVFSTRARKRDRTTEITRSRRGKV